MTPWTVEEFQRSLRRSERYLRRYPVPPSEFAELAADAASEEDFVTAYWRKVKSEPGLKPGDFVALYAELEPHLSDLGIAVVKDGCTAVEQDEQSENLEIAFLERAIDGYSAPRGPKRVLHDARHRGLITRLRGEGSRRFANAGYWFLTHDSILPRYDFIARGGKSADLPFCVTAGSWFQVIQAFRPKSDDPEGALADLVASPYVRYRRTLTKEGAQSLAARVALHKDATPELAARLLMNSALADEIEAASTAEERAETIDRAVVTEAKMMHEDARAAVDRAKREAEAAQRLAEQRGAAAESARSDSEGALANERERRERAIAEQEERRERALAEERERGERRLRDVETSHAEAVKQRDAEIHAMGARLEGFKRVARIVAVLMVLGGLFTFAAVLFDISTAWAYLGAIGVILGIAAAVDQFVAPK